MPVDPFTKALTAAAQARLPDLASKVEALRAINLNQLKQAQRMRTSSSHSQSTAERRGGSLFTGSLARASVDRATLKQASGGQTARGPLLEADCVSPPPSRFFDCARWFRRRLAHRAVRV